MKTVFKLNSFILVVCLSISMFCGCTNSKIKNNVINKVEENRNEKQIESIEDNSEEEVSTCILGDNFAKVPVAVSKDKKIIFYTCPSSGNNKLYDYVLKGRVHEELDLIRFNAETGEQKVAASAIPRINIAKWNSRGDKIAFCGGNNLIVYDINKDKRILEDLLKNERTAYFGWSPDGNRIFTEHPNLDNGSIIYINSNKIEEAYENKEKIYFKGVLDKNFYFANERIMNVDEEKGSPIVVVDKDGKIIKKAAAGRFRDSYKKAILFLNNEGFGLYYMPDIDNPNNIVKLTDEYIYDTKFVIDGKFAYITKNSDVEENNFILTIVNNKGEKINSFDIYGSSFTLAFDGKKGYVSAPYFEVVDFEENKIIYNSKLDSSNKISEMNESREPIYKTIRSAFEVIYNFEMTGKKDYEKLKKYFINTDAPQQWALFDMENIFENCKAFSIPSDNYSLYLELKDYKYHKKDSIESVSVKVQGKALNSEGSGVGISKAVELIKKDNKWYVTGFSTFPYTNESENIKSIVKEHINEMVKGNLYEGKFKNKEISIGQIQFWEMSSPHYSYDIESSNYCKVYIQVKDKGNGDEFNREGKIFTLILKKKSNNNWIVTEIGDKSLWNREL